MKLTEEIEEFINLTITEHMGKEYAEWKIKQQSVAEPDKVEKRYRAVRILPDVTGKWQKQIRPGVQKKKVRRRQSFRYFTQFRRKIFLKKMVKKSNSQ